ncbi:alpha/beta fold hydrolase [Agrobacterium vitis]|uniref:Alpha/beta fold hydrolase n=1 Tax=Agrobacterium vitis TaxID=373 RepID=A0AAE2R9P4_AGRVI|nr:alpha/beta fold hydrolase [Agrobacterium vitis]MBF2713579.1 alpha/beta fold hydrolase [Agrobacterium vitis]MUZ62946.1 alpha/beta fold hydrolase [Agrobacterium vitis]MVA18639.1 alpha/beta fold hydrolase [Agrobacterium vitis]
MSTDALSFFQEGSNGSGILLVHGLTGAPAEMRLVARQLHRRGYSVYAPLLAGHGTDEAALRKTRWQDWLESVEEAGQVLASRVDAAFAAGICAGGKLALMAADRQPLTLRAAAIYSPCFHYDGWDIPRHYNFMARNIRWLAKIPFLDRLSFHETRSLGIKDDRLRNKIAAMNGDGVLESFPGKGLVEMDKLGRVLKARLPLMQTPTLIVHSLEDDVSSPSHAQYISSHLGGPRELHWLRDSYHMIHMDRQHRHVADLTADFFEAHYVPNRA